MHNLLQWPDWTIVDVAEDERDIYITAYPYNSPGVCPHCDTPGELQQFGRRTHLVRDTPIRGKRVGIHVQRQRWRCKACGKTFWQPLPEVHLRHTMTLRLVAHIEKQSLPRTFVEVADEVGVTEATVRNIFKAYVQRIRSLLAIWTATVKLPAPPTSAMSMPMKCPGSKLSTGLDKIG